MRRLFILVAFVVGGSSLIAQHEAERVPYGSVTRLEFPAAAIPFGTAVLVDRERDADGTTTLYYLTSGQLFAAVRPRVEGEQRDGVHHVGVLRIFADESAVVPWPMRFDSPAPGEMFTIVGVDPDDRVSVVFESVSSVSTRHVTGDRTITNLVGCIGAPAMLSGAVFGIVTSCDDDQPPTIELLGPSRSLLSQRIPLLRSSHQMDTR